MANQNNQNLLTNMAKVIQTELMYYTPVFINPLDPNVNLSSIYCFLGQIDPWEDPLYPPVPKQDNRSMKEVFKNMFVMKRILTNNISPVLKRVDWQPNTVYDYYLDTVDMSEKDNQGNNLYNYYVKNSYDQVFKCLWNNNSTTDNPQFSTVEPIFEPGLYNEHNIFQGEDGYKWKFMFTVDSGTKINFMDDSWIPLPVGEYAVGEAGVHSDTIGSGNIDVINVTNGGSGYDMSNAAISVVITGDGAGAEATAVANTQTGKITDIIVTNRGSNYTHANVEIISSLGSGATAICPISPIGGHGSDPTSELAASNIMFVCEYDGSENGMVPTDITYYQVGLLMNPSDLLTSPNPANSAIYSLTTDIGVAAGLGTYNSGEIVYQGTKDNPTFSGTVLSFDVAKNTIHLININGSITMNSPIFGSTTLTARTVTNYSIPNNVPFTGYIVYIENREGIERSSDGIEQFKFVLGY